jgi:hypothetical protein
MIGSNNSLPVSYVLVGNLGLENVAIHPDSGNVAACSLTF